MPSSSFAPVNLGGEIVVGNVGNLGTTVNGGTQATGGQFSLDLDIPVPLSVMQLQNLKGWEDRVSHNMDLLKQGNSPYLADSLGLMVDFQDSIIHPPSYTSARSKGAYHPVVTKNLSMREKM